MDRLNSTFRNHLNISDTIASSITGLSISKIKMISGFTPLDALDLRSLLPDSIQPLILLSYPANIATDCAEGGACGIDRVPGRDSAVGFWGTLEKKLEGSSFLEPLSSRQAALQKTITELTAKTPLLRKISRSAWLRGASSSSAARLGTTTATPNYPSRVYGKGPKDALFVLFWAVAFTILRELTMRYILQPLMRRRLKQLDAKRRMIANDGKASKQDTNDDDMTASRRRESRLREKTVTRFAEQGWTFTYATTFFTIGMVSERRT